MLLLNQSRWGFLGIMGIGLWTISLRTWPLVLSLFPFLVSSCWICRGESSRRNISDFSVIGFKVVFFSLPASAVLDLITCRGSAGHEGVVITLGWRFAISTGRALQIRRINESSRAAIDV